MSQNSISDLSFEFEWESPGAARGEELRATWARLEIRIDDEVVTRVHDLRTRGVRDGIYLPLYPLAEWLCENWLYLKFEAFRPHSRNFAFRHDLATARQGYALPPLLFVPSGNIMELTWSGEQFQPAGVQFLSHGQALISMANFERQANQLIDAVLDRLRQQGVTDTHLANAWNDLQELDEAEHKFLRAAAMLGVDAAELTPQQEEELLEADELLPEGVRDEFYGAADSDHLKDQAMSVQQAASKAEQSATSTSRLKELRESARSAPTSQLPWESGYLLAQRIRQQLKPDGCPIPTTTAFYDQLQVSNGWSTAESTANGPFDGVVRVGEQQEAAILISGPREDSRLFALARGLGEYLTAPTGSNCLLSAATTYRQKRNRAFAAELLAPSDDLAQRIGNGYVTQIQIEDWANEFGVSPYVIRHQIRNHRLSEIQDW